MVKGRLLRDMAFEVLEEHGAESIGQWTDDREKAFHLRRRLSVEEQLRVGDAMDCRIDKDVVTARLKAMIPFIPLGVLGLVMQELEARKES